MTLHRATNASSKNISHNILHFIASLDSSWKRYNCEISEVKIDKVDAYQSVHFIRRQI